MLDTLYIIISVSAPTPTPDTFLSVCAALFFSTSLIDKPREVLQQKLQKTITNKLTCANTGEYLIYAEAKISEAVEEYNKKVENYHNGTFLWICLGSGAMSLISLLFCHLYNWALNAYLFIPIVYIVYKHYKCYNHCFQSAMESIKKVTDAKSLIEEIEDMKSRASRIVEVDELGPSYNPPPRAKGVDD